MSKPSSSRGRKGKGEADAEDDLIGWEAHRFKKIHDLPTEQHIMETAKESWMDDKVCLAILYNPERCLKRYPKLSRSERLHALSGSDVPLSGSIFLSPKAMQDDDPWLWTHEDPRSLLCNGEGPFCYILRVRSCNPDLEKREAYLMCPCDYKLVQYKVHDEFMNDLVGMASTTLHLRNIALDIGGHLSVLLGSDVSKYKASASFQKDVVNLEDGTKSERSTDDIIRNERKICYPSRTARDAIEVSYSDMACLDPTEYLKDSIIDFYLRYLVKSKPRRDLFICHTKFYEKFKEARPKQKDDKFFITFRKWWQGVDIFKQAYMLLPVNESKHWSLLIVCMPTKEADSGLVMLHLDSLGFHDSDEIFDTVASYLEVEWRHLQQKDSYEIPLMHLERNMNRERVEVPQQPNKYDCGFFMLHFIERFIQEAPERWTKDGINMFGRKWFNPEEASQLRQSIRTLLLGLFQDTPEDMRQD